MDLSKLSDDELRALYNQHKQPPTDVSKMTDEELKAAYAAQPKAPTGLQQTLDTAKGIYNAADAGMASGVAGLAGAPRFLSDLGAAGIRKASDAISDFTGMERYDPKTQGPVKTWLDENLP